MGRRTSPTHEDIKVSMKPMKMNRNLFMDWGRVRNAFGEEGGLTIARTVADDHPAEGDGEGDMAESHEAPGDGAQLQVRHGESDDFEERGFLLVQLDALKDASPAKEDPVADEAECTAPEVNADEETRGPLALKQTRHDVVDGTEEDHGGESVGSEVGVGDGVVGEMGDAVE